MLTKIPSPASFHVYTTDLKEEVVESWFQSGRKPSKESSQVAY